MAQKPWEGERFRVDGGKIADCTLEQLDDELRTTENDASEKGQFAIQAEEAPDAQKRSLIKETGEQRRPHEQSTCTSASNLESELQHQSLEIR